MSLDIVHDADKLCERILAEWLGGCPAEMPESVQRLTHDAVRLAELHREIVGRIVVGFVAVTQRRDAAIGQMSN